MMKEETFNRLCKDIKERLEEKVSEIIVDFWNGMYIDSGDCHFELEIMLDVEEERLAKQIATILAYEQSNSLEEED